MSPEGALPVGAEAVDRDRWRGAATAQGRPCGCWDGTGGGPGDCLGIVRRRPLVVSSSGANAIGVDLPLTPPTKGQGDSVSDHRDLAPMLARCSDFSAVMATAHRLRLRVAIDLALSPASDQHPWFGESGASRDGFRANSHAWADAVDGTPPGHWPSIFGGPAGQRVTGRRQRHSHTLLVSQTILSLRGPEVQDAILDGTLVWLGREVNRVRLDSFGGNCLSGRGLRGISPLMRERRSGHIACVAPRGRSFCGHGPVPPSSRWRLGPAALRDLATPMTALCGPACLCRGEEMGFPEAEAACENRRSLYGIPFRPAFTGRDGCRTLMLPSDLSRRTSLSDVEPWLLVPHARLHLGREAHEAEPGPLLRHDRHAFASRRRVRAHGGRRSSAPASSAARPCARRGPRGIGVRSKNRLRRWCPSPTWRETRPSWPSGRGNPAPRSSINIGRSRPWRT